MKSTLKSFGVFWKASFVYLFAVVLAVGCTPISERRRESAGSQESKVFALGHISAFRGKAFLEELGLGRVSSGPGDDRVSITGSPVDLRKAGIVLDLVDARESFTIERLAPVSAARVLPANAEIASALGDIAVGTFDRPPDPCAGTRAIIDVHGDAVIAIVPVRFYEEMLSLIGGIPDEVGREKDDGIPQVEIPGAPVGPSSEYGSAVVRDGGRSPAHQAGFSQEPISSSAMDEIHSLSIMPTESGAVPRVSREKLGSPAAQVAAVSQTNSTSATADSGNSLERVKDESSPEVIEITPASSNAPTVNGPSAPDAYALPVLANGEDVLQLDLPDRLEIAQLLDLAAEYLDLDYIYEPEKIRGQTVSLKLHGKLGGEIRVRELYPLLESVLTFKGFVMSCPEGRLVTIVPVADALEADPEIIDPSGEKLDAGDMVVTRVFELGYLDASSAMNLIDSMKLSVAMSPIKETRSLIVTCYLHRMRRIERLLSMIDRPGKQRKVQFRQMIFVTAAMLAEKMMVIADELRTFPLTVGVTKTAPTTRGGGSGAPPSPFPVQTAAQTVNSEAEAEESVFLDADERTNRILMIGYEEQLATLGQLVDALDIPQPELRPLKVYEVRHIEADEAWSKLEELKIIKAEPGLSRASTSKTGQVPTPAPSPFAGGPTASQVGGELVEPPHVVVLKQTNSLLASGTPEQHDQLANVLAHIDAAPQDFRELRTYDIQHVEALTARSKLEEIEVLGMETASDGSPSSAGTLMSPSPPSPPQSGGLPGTDRIASAVSEGAVSAPQVVVLESSNSLLINATEEQHARIVQAIRYIDTEFRQEAIPYEVYSLENQDPEALAEVLEKLIHEKVKDQEDKVQAVVRRADEEITIVPDKNTYSLIVYASQKNQGCIRKLIETLDKRRPQVLIDVTLVEITEADSFNYDLNLVRGWSTLSDTSGVSGVDPNSDMIGTLFDSTGGTLTAFYGDRQVQTLLTAVQSKNYGRVLAKPKVLVNDNEPGSIKTTDTTYVQTRSSVPVTSGGAGNQENLIETSVNYTAYEAGITLDITPHISEGDLLRLDIALTRSDFLPTEDKDKPPNTTASEITTAVTVPDGSTIILGGLLKLNQNKGGMKVPILGDVPVLGGLFRGINNTDKQSKLYVFVKAEIIRPSHVSTQGMEDLEAISERNRRVFEKHESEFQDYQSWPGVKPKPTSPERVLEAE